MKRNLLMLITLLLSGFMAAAQSGAKRNCASNEVFEAQMKNEKFAAKQVQIEANYQRFLNTNGIAQAAAGTRTIPVYVHVLYKTAQENISDAQIQSQISVLNEDYSATNSDIGSVPSAFSSIVANYDIQFSITAITRTSTTKTSWGTNDAMKKSSQGGVNPITPDTHMNIWICNIGGGILGYAQFPGGASSTDGIVFSPQYCGSADYDTNNNFYLSAPFNKGRTATHEVGHYLNLRHIWGDGDCSASDFVSDTPSAGAPNYGCPTYPSSSCGSADMTMNYMDYVDDVCMYMFTEGQKTRTASIFANGGSRENLGTVGGTSCSLAAPAGLAASNVSTTGFTLSWNAVSSATSYDVTVGGSTSTVTGTSSTVSGLTAGTAYATSVVANCATGSGAAASLSVTTSTAGGGTGCNTGDVTLSLTTDKYASETSWTLKDANGTTVASNGTLANNSTTSSTFSNLSGSYTFTINDSYGDGICCSYGNGSYTLTGSNGVIVTDGAFGSSKATTFCVDAAADTQAPTKPSSLSSSNITISSFSISWSASSDNVGVDHYAVTMNGSTSNTSSLSKSYSGLASGTAYSVSVVAVDAAGNTSSAASGTVTTDSPDTQAPTRPGAISSSSITENSFSVSWGASSDNVGVVNYAVTANGTTVNTTGTSRSFSGLNAGTAYTVSVVASDAAGNTSAARTTSVTTTAVVDNCFKTNVTLSLTFDNYPAETSWTLKNSAGTTVASGNGYSTKGATITETFTLANGDYTFTMVDSYGDGICCSYGNGSYTVTDGLGATIVTDGAFGASKATDFCISGSNARTQNPNITALETIAADLSVSLFPNPAFNNLNMVLSENASVTIYSTAGQLVYSAKVDAGKTSISVSNLRQGLYIVNIVSSTGGMKRTKFIKQ